MILAVLAGLALAALAASRISLRRGFLLTGPRFVELVDDLVDVQCRPRQRDEDDASG